MWTHCLRLKRLVWWRPLAYRIRLTGLRMVASHRTSSGFIATNICILLNYTAHTSSLSSSNNITLVHNHRQRAHYLLVCLSFTSWQHLRSHLILTYPVTLHSVTTQIQSPYTHTSYVCPAIYCHDPRADSSLYYRGQIPLLHTCGHCALTS